MLQRGWPGGRGAARLAAPMLVVQKYGGSSVADVARVKQVAARVADTVAAGHQVVVVVSAMGNTTSELLGLAKEVSAAPRRRELDLLISVGERVSMTLLAMAIHDLGVPAASFTGSQSGIITDEQHVNAKVLEVRPHRIREALEAGKVAIVAGFQGVSRTREVTTLGRGGSDTTAVVLAAALGAAWCELCSDVDGVYTADPRVVPGARRMDTLSLDAAAAMTQAGAKVLQAEAVAQAQAMGVQLHATATASPTGSGTRLPPGPIPSAPVAIVADQQLELWQGPLDAMVPEGTHVRELQWDDSGATALVDLRNRHAPPPSGVQAQPVALLSVVGGGMESAMIPDVIGILPDKLLSAWLRPSGLGLLLPRHAAPAAQRTLHARFLEESAPDAT